MNWRWLAIVATGLAVIGVATSEPALARKGNKAKIAKTRCVDQIGGPTLRGIWFNTEPRPNGCSPAVYEYGRFIGQDPDPNIRIQLLRQPETGYTITK
ncbi:MAG: hypothetical protein WC670_15125 [Pseudolabrys sp.]|jgi:hypothetical protein